MFDNTNTPLITATVLAKENISAAEPLRSTQSKLSRRARTRLIINSSDSKSKSSLQQGRPVVPNPRRRRAQVAPAKLASQFLQLSLDVNELDMTNMPSTGNTLRIPKHLPRAPVRYINPALLPEELRHVSMDYIQDCLVEIGPVLFDSAKSVVADPPRNELPCQLEVQYDNKGQNTESPSHLFAIHSKTSTAVSLFPIHAIVFTSHCANLPALPASRTIFTKGSVTLPVVPLRIPHPASFPTLMHYLYTKKIDQLVASLLPNPIADDVSMHTLLNQIGRVYGLWMNAVALGVCEDKIWPAVDDVWVKLLDALQEKIATTSS
ncbi:hypothetical protein M422DRAFT_782340 [Sphaerobolus stellatus SS14]|uniref:Clp1 n=1 Tax=Sphaerobolus stellatus (strain SS14) TaxID=990650 RepID=A0A0C9UMW3_SPHS4|nr:hypothetical protein M422DRAFT_782340 [Sphaerobolus stellatus SS14]